MLFPSNRVYHIDYASSRDRAWYTQKYSRRLSNSPPQFGHKTRDDHSNYVLYSHQGLDNMLFWQVFSAFYIYMLSGDTAKEEMK